MDTFKAYYQFFGAIKNDDREKITEVLDQYPDCVEWVEKRNLERTGLISAASANKPDLVRFLLENGANPLAKQWAGGTALVVAADQGPSHLKVVQVLLEYPQDLNNLDVHQTLPLWKAAQSSNNQKMVDLLIDAGANPNIPGTDTADEPIYMVPWGESKSMSKCLMDGKTRWDAQHLEDNTTPVPQVRRRPGL